MRITARAQAKINWSLDVCAGRDDGYHELDMLMQRVDLSDVLTFVISAVLIAKTYRELRMPQAA